jgi:drug/metabolite transporter (DMT)-like permease
MAVALLPFFAFESVSHEIVHKGVILVSVILAIGGFCWGVRRHRAWHLLLLVGSGIGLLTFSQFGSHTHAEMIAAGGALCLAASHWINRQLCKRCLRCEQLGK